MKKNNPSEPGAARAGRGALISACAFSLIGAAYHIIGGTPEVMDPVYASDLPIVSTSVLDVLWYQMALLLVAAAVGAGVAAVRRDWRWPVAWIIGGQFLAIAAACLLFSVIWFGHPWGLSQFVLFAVIGALTFWGAVRQ